MGKIAFIYPGQGSQTVGMGKDVYDAIPQSRQVFERADEVLGFRLSELIFNGPDTELKRTVNTQPALLTTSIALHTALSDAGIVPDYVAGHSLGEYSALAVSGALSFEDAVAIVRARGEFMEQAVPFGEGAMAAVLGAEREALAILCQDITSNGNLVELANMNCPGQIVVSGTKDGVRIVGERVKEVGGKRAIALEVSGPFHSSLMEPAAERLRSKLDQAHFHNASIPVIANVTALPVLEGKDIKSLLVQQVYSPVLWEDSVRYMIEQGTDTFVEIGSGSVLAGLVKKIDKNVRTVNVNSLTSVNEFKSILS